MFLIPLFIGLSFFVVTQEGQTLNIKNPFKPGSALVNIGGNVKTLTRSTSCKPKNWNNSQENACLCCVTKHSLMSNGQFDYSGKAISKCLDEEKCTNETLDRIAESLNTSFSGDAPEIIASRIIDSVQVVATSGKIGKEYHEDNKLTPEGVTKALSILARQNKIRNTASEVEECFKVEPLEDKGAQTVQTFMVSRSTYCNRLSKAGKKLFDGLYIIKELGKGLTEVRNTTLVKESFLGQYSLDNPDRPNGFPAIALDAISFKYEDDQRNPHYLSVLTLAPGLPIFKILKNFATSYKKHSDEGTLTSGEFVGQLTKTRHSMASLGGQVGRLHATYMTRDKKGRLTGKSNAVHGDMHSNNIFEDDNLNVIFIDAETFSIGLKSPRSVGKDLLRIYLFSTVRNAAHQNPRKGNVKQTYWHNQVIKPFLREYILAYTFLNGEYSQQNFEDAMRILRSIFSLSGAGSDPEAVFVRAGAISSLRAYWKYITPLLNDLEKEITSHPNPIELSILGPSIQGKKTQKPWENQPGKALGLALMM